MSEDGAGGVARDAWMACTRRGDFAGAWAISDALLQEPAQPWRPRHYQSIWRGERLHDRRVLIRCYHGLGDTIQFIRYAPQVRAIAREVIVWAPAALLPLLRRVEGVDVVLELHDGDPGIAHDVDVEVMELPHVFRSTLDTLPRRIPYLYTPGRRVPGGPPRIGLFWRGGSWEPRRWMRFDDARRLLDVEGVTWCSLEPDHGAGGRDPRMVDLGDGDLSDLAARVSQLDLVITVDSMPAHLAGALGIQVWTLLPRLADWRWLENRDDTPWYPTMRLFRQDREGEWRPVVDRVACAVRHFKQLYEDVTAA